MNQSIVSMSVAFKATELDEVARGQRLSGAGKEGGPGRNILRGPLLLLFWVWAVLHLLGLSHSFRNLSGIA